MSSSPEHLVLPAEPRAVRVQQGSAAEVLEVMLEERMAERERVAADAARAELASQLERVVEAFATEQAVVQDELARAAACLGVEVARAILRTELDADRYELEGVVREVHGQRPAARQARYGGDDLLERKRIAPVAVDGVQAGGPAAHVVGLGLDGDR